MRVDSQSSSSSSGSDEMSSAVNAVDSQCSNFSR